MAGTAPKKILLLCAPDGFANSVRPAETENYLRRRGHEVETIDVLASEQSRSARSVARRWMPRFVQQLGSQLLLRRRARRLARLIRQKQPDIVICETYAAAYALTKPLSCVTVYDAPTLYADEAFFGGKVSKPVNALHRRTELEIFRSVDHLTFHWDSFNDYVKQHYTGEHGYDGTNLFTLNWGCAARSRGATFRSPPRVVCLGWLDGYWVNLPLLVALSRLYPIDVYGGPPPDERLGLNYLGYAPLDVLSEYQFGLITITDDALRRDGFSSKHLEYVSYGLPVLCPEWRQDRRLSAVTIPYNEGNFLAQLRRCSDPQVWQALHEACVSTAAQLSWERQLRPLDEIVGTSTMHPGVDRSSA